MRVLVTRANGYIGSVLVPEARRAGHVVVGLDSDLFAHCSLEPCRQNAMSVAKDVLDVVSSDHDLLQVASAGVWAGGVLA